MRDESAWSGVLLVALPGLSSSVQPPPPHLPDGLCVFLPALPALPSLPENKSELHLS